MTFVSLMRMVLLATLSTSLSTGNPLVEPAEFWPDDWVKDDGYQSANEPIKRFLHTIVAVTNTWGRVEGALVCASVGECGVWGVTHKEQIFYRENSYGREGEYGTDWVQITGSLSQVDVGSNTVWGVNSNGNVYYRSGISAAAVTGTTWTTVSGNLKHVSVSQKGHVWGVNIHDYIYHRRDASNINIAGSSWHRTEGLLKQISIGESGVWGVNDEDKIFYREGTYGDPNTDPDGTHWTHVAPGRLRYISSGNGHVYGTTSVYTIFYRAGLSSSNPTGTSWVRISGGMRQIDALSNVVWGTQESQYIWAKETD